MSPLSHPPPRRGLQAKHLSAIDALHAQLTGPFGAEQAAAALGRDVPRTRRLLAWLAASGWLSRVQRGLYVLVPLGTRQPAGHPAQPWLLARRLFAPCYLGGFTALHHWGLTEQLFSSVCVFTRKRRERREVVVQGTRFLLRLRKDAAAWGTRRAWVDGVPVDVSDPSLTIVDALDDPSCAGGLVHAALALRQYWESEHRNVVALLDSVARRGNRSVYKRLGYLAEHLELGDSALLAACRDRQSTGVVRLDPQGPSRGRIVRRWNLRINRALDPQARS